MWSSSQRHLCKLLDDSSVYAAALHRKIAKLVYTVHVILLFFYAYHQMISFCLYSFWIIFKLNRFGLFPNLCLTSQLFILRNLTKERNGVESERKSACNYYYSKDFVMGNSVQQLFYLYFFRGGCKKLDISYIILEINLVLASFIHYFRHLKLLSCRRS